MDLSNMTVLVALGLASFTLLVGVLLRAKIGFLRNFLVPSCVIGGILGFALMNISPLGMNTAENASVFTELTNIFFTLSFISIGLTGNEKKEAEEKPEKGKKAKKGGAAKQIIRGAIGMGFVWSVLYSITPLIGYGCVMLSNLLCPGQSLDPKYGMLIPFAFAQGPGQSATFGALFESHGLENAAMVAITFSVIGFIIAFLVGVPCAKLGIKKGLAKNCTEITDSVKRGVFRPDEQVEGGLGKATTHNGNIDPLTVHIALVGITYLITYIIIELLNNDSMRSMMFIYGMLVAYFVKFVMKVCKFEHVQNNDTQKRVTGFFTDFVVVCAFMAVQVSIIAKWIVPILIVCAVVGVVTFFVSMYFAKRFGDSNDFERFLGLWGTSTGTVPTGVSLVRIVDPDQKTTTAVELGAMNLAMIPSYVYIFLVPLYLQGTMSFGMLSLAMAAVSVVALVVILVLKLWGKPSFSFRKGSLLREEAVEGSAEASADAAEESETPAVE